MHKGIIAIGLMLSSLQANANMNTRIYGYIDGYFEAAEDSPQIGTSEGSKNPLTYDVPNIHMIVMSSKDSYKSYFNISGGGAEELDVRNAWVEKEIFGEKLAFRLGEMYRKFGLYNEILDATPTYIGIEPPEMFDGDHLFLTRTTNAMFHGQFDLGADKKISYSVTTGNDERKSDAVPVGVDVNYTVGTNWKVGASYYNSGGQAKSDSDGTAPGSGGVLAWMAHDTFDVTGAYVQYTDANWIVQLESTVTNHDAVRDSGRVTTICNDATLNSRQRARFNCGGTLDLDGDYEASTTYLRVGHVIPLTEGSITPYAQYDVYENKEMIWEEDFGGDNEGGLADDGRFEKWTLGTVYRPDFNVAMKADYSQHVQKVNGKQDNYGEIRFSFSYFWSLL